MAWLNSKNWRVLTRWLIVVLLAVTPASAFAQAEQLSNQGSDTVGIIFQIVGALLALWLIWRVLFGESSED
ncbi:MAG: hypothetical protein ACQEVA_21505, partial [Myxococcota bacterium]